MDKSTLLLTKGCVVGGIVGFIMNIMNKNTAVESLLINIVLSGLFISLFFLNDAIDTAKDKEKEKKSKELTVSKES